MFLQAQVHPRSRGEYLNHHVLSSSILGSPPLTRGILSGGGIYRTPFRFTPAHAGNTDKKLKSVSIYWVHPRSRGEYIPLRLTQSAVVGSPPLTRGIQAGDQKGDEWARVHPRSRGEYSLLVDPEYCARGSPPLTRGIPLCGFCGRSCHRFTPAHAGNTLTSLHLNWLTEVHPRSRGEY